MPAELTTSFRLSPRPQTDEAKQLLIAQFSEKSRLNAAFSFQCLEGNGWDLDRAWINFIELKVRPLLCPSPLLIRVGR
jgi:hypothetical protein